MKCALCNGEIVGKTESYQYPIDGGFQSENIKSFQCIKCGDKLFDVLNADKLFDTITAIEKIISNLHDSGNHQQTQADP